MTFKLISNVLSGQTIGNNSEQYKHVSLNRELHTSSNFIITEKSFSLNFHNHYRQIYVG